MSYFKFDDDDIIHNTLKTHPECHFYMWADPVGKIRLTYNNQKKTKTSFHVGYPENPPNVRHVPPGFVSLYEVNIDRPYNETTSESDMIYPFITKDSGMTSFATISTSQFNGDFAYGDMLTGSYAMSASISSQAVPSGKHLGGDPDDGLDQRRKRDALRTTFDYYTRYSNRFSYHNGLEGIDPTSSSWENQAFRLLQVPSIFYGERIKKGSLKLDWYDAGVLLATAEDSKQNGEVIVTYSTKPTEIGKFVGLVFYSEGFIVLSNTDESKIYDATGNATADTWKNFMEDLEDYNPTTDPVGGYPVTGQKLGHRHFSLYFKGTHTIPTMTMLANVEKGECSHSNNPTFIDSDFQYINFTNPVSVTNIGNANPVTFTTAGAHNLGLIGEYVYGKIENYVSNSVNPFDNHDLRFKIKSATEFEVHRVNDSGLVVPLLNDEIATPDLPTNAVFSVKHNTYQRNQPLTGTHGYFEKPNFKIKNTVKSSYNDPYAEFEDHTYISKIAIYDEDRNMIGIAKLATPIKKTMKRDFTFKLKIDL